MLEHTTGVVFVAFWLGLPFRERNNFIRFLKNIIVLHLQIFNTQNHIIFKISIYILEIFLKIRKFLPAK